MLWEGHISPPAIHVPRHQSAPHRGSLAGGGLSFSPAIAYAGAMPMLPDNRLVRVILAVVAIALLLFGLGLAWIAYNDVSHLPATR